MASALVAFDISRCACMCGSLLCHQLFSFKGSLTTRSLSLHFAYADTWQITFWEQISGILLMAPWCYYNH